MRNCSILAHSLAYISQNNTMFYISMKIYLLSCFVYKICVYVYSKCLFDSS